MNNIQCHFCKRLCRAVDTKQSYFNTLNIGFGRAWQCDYHGAVRVWHVPDTDDIVLVVIYKEQLYLAFFYYGNKQPVKFRIFKPNRYPEQNQPILSLEFHPDITPENIQQKLPTLILFS